MTVSAPDGYAIEPIEVATASDAELRALAGFQRELDIERVPEDPAAPIELSKRQPP